MKIENHSCISYAAMLRGRLLKGVQKGKLERRKEDGARAGGWGIEEV